MITKHEAKIATLVAIIKTLITEGKHRINRTTIGGLLERDYQYHGFGKGLTSWIKEACDQIPGASVTPKIKNRVYVVYTP